MNYWCEYALLDRCRVGRGVLLDVDGGTITAVSEGVPAQGTVLRGVTVAGIANAHSHAFQRALRARTEHGGGGRPGSFWTWREQMYDLVDRLTPETFGALAEATFAEMLCAGYTCVGEFHYLHHAAHGVHYANPNEMSEVLVAAAEAAGIRLTLLDACYLHSGSAQPLGAAQQRFSDTTAARWVERVASFAPASPLVRPGAAVHSVRAVPPAEIAVVADHARHAGWTLHAHVSEQPAENEYSLAQFGCTPTAVLAAHGALRAPFTAVHATHLVDDDVRLLGEGEAAVCLCPTTERDLADGVAGTAALTAAGVTLCVGSDSQAQIDPFEELRSVEMHTRLSTGQRGTHAASDLLAGATAGGYRSLGWESGGVLAAGALADFVAVRLDSVRLAGTRLEEVAAALVFAAGAADVGDVVVDGRHVVVDGRHHRIDIGRALAEAIGAVWR